MEPRLKKLYKEQVVKQLQKELDLKSVMAVPAIKQVTLNMGVGTAVTNKNELESAVAELSSIAGQRAVKTFAKKAISNFKIREGNAIGTKVTLRGDRMYYFLDNFLNIALPRVRDFKGVSPKSFDGRGNYSLGIKEQIIFPEVSYDKVDKIRGLDICITTTAKNDQEGLALLKAMGMPFRKPAVQAT
jgi:large subunit ribosomal protein L5